MQRFRGSLDVEITLKGYSDAVEAGFNIDDVDVIIHDWQKRTIETARCLQIAHPEAKLEQWPVHSQRLGWLEGKKVTADTLSIMSYYVSHPEIVPHPSFRPDCEPPQCFMDWISSWFMLYDDLRHESEDKERYTVIVTHNRNIQAVLARVGNFIDFRKFNVAGPRPCEVVKMSTYLSLMRHAETPYGG